MPPAEPPEEDPAPPVPPAAPPDVPAAAPWPGVPPATGVCSATAAPATPGPVGCTAPDGALPVPVGAAEPDSPAPDWRRPPALVCPPVPSWEWPGAEAPAETGPPDTDGLPAPSTSVHPVRATAASAAAAAPTAAARNPERSPPRNSDRGPAPPPSILLPTVRGPASRSVRRPPPTALLSPTAGPGERTRPFGPGATLAARAQPYPSACSRSSSMPK